MSHPWLLSPVLQAYLCKIAISVLLDICYVIWYMLNILWMVDMWNYIISKLFIKREQGDGLLVDCYQSVLCRYVCYNGIVMQLGWCVSTFCVVVFWRLCVFYHTCKSIMSEWKIRGGKMWGLKIFSPNLRIKEGSILLLRFGKGCVGNLIAGENCFYETELRLKIPLPRHLAFHVISFLF